MIKNPVDTALEKDLDYLKLPYLKENCRPFAAEGNAKHWSHIDYLARLIEGEAAARHDRTILHRIKAARFPVIKTLEAFRWDWPKKINQLQIRICSGCASLTKKPMLSSWVYAGSELCRGPDYAG